MGSRTRRLFQVAPVSVVAATFALWVTNGCAWEYEVISTTDETSVEDTGAAETLVSDADDTAVSDGPFTLPDGRVCTGHDEDNDGVPDDCDNCPNVANPGQSGGPVGAACAPATAFIPSASRLLFDPFKSMSAWKAFGAGTGVFELGPDMDTLVGGSLSDELRFVQGSTGAGASAVVATTTVTILEEANGSSGLLLRINGTDPKKFYLCALSLANGFAVARADPGCSGGLCAPITFTTPNPDGGLATPAQLPIPADIPHKPGDMIGLRASASVSMGDGGILGDVECRVFDPKRPSTLQASDDKYAIKVTAGGTRWFPTGEVGLYAQRSKAVFGSIDVLRGP